MTSPSLYYTLALTLDTKHSSDAAGNKKKSSSNLFYQRLEKPIVGGVQSQYRIELDPGETKTVGLSGTGGNRLLLAASESTFQIELFEGDATAPLPSVVRLFVVEYADDFDQDVSVRITNPTVPVSGVTIDPIFVEVTMLGIED